MKLRLIGHGYKYAVEQIMLMMFPGERPEYTDAPDGEAYAAVSLSIGGTWTTAATRLTVSGKTAKALSRVKTAELKDKLSTDRLCQKIIKLSFYGAAVKITGKKPEWGALTGIRPGKIAAASLLAGDSERAAARRLERVYFVSPERAALCVAAAEAGIRARKNLSQNDVCLYIGIPFCPTRCAYCSFVSSSVEKSMKLIDPFLDALSREITATAETAKTLGLRVVSVYLGGGTPTTLSSAQLSDVFKRLRGEFDLQYAREITVEAGRPDTITPEKLKSMQLSGVTRISINPQTMEPRVLEAIGRRHTPEDVVRAFHEAREAGFTNVNMDMIAGLPADSADGFKRSLDRVLELEPENITVHTLSRKRGTRITLEETGTPGEGEVGEMLDYASRRLSGAGFSPYYLYRQKFMSGGFENVGWCKSGLESLYNICIMEELCTILAMGGGASTKLCRLSSGRIERIFNAKYPLEYIESIDRIICGKARIIDFYREEDKA